MNTRKFFAGLVLQTSHFDHAGDLHGIAHTYRVMILVHQLSILLNRKDLALPALAAAFIHDMARQHDGYCTMHGKWAAENKLPLFKDFFLDTGIREQDLLLIAVAIENHSLMKELEPHNPAFLLTAILKDADALDRIRLGEGNLDKKFLRINKSKGLIDFARKLYFSSCNLIFHNFTEILDYTNLINQKKLR